MPLRSRKVEKTRAENLRDNVFHFYDEDYNRIAVTFRDLVFMDGLLLSPERYAISHDDGIIISANNADRFQLIKC